MIYITVQNTLRISYCVIMTGISLKNYVKRVVMIIIHGLLWNDSFITSENRYRDINPFSAGPSTDVIF